MKLTPLYVTLLLTLLILTPSLSDAQNSKTMERCNTDYHNGQYEQAISCYQEIDSEVFSSAVFYNIGNSYAQLNQVGNAVLYYQRALCLSPGDSDISGNLALIRNEEGLFSPESTVIENIAGLLSIAQWSLLALAGITVYLLFAIVQLKNRQSRTVEIIVIMCCAIITFIGATGALTQHNKWGNSVVISDSKLLLSPFKKAASSGTIEQGRMVFPHKRHSKFWYVTDETGRSGWITEHNIAPILPSNQ